MRASSVVLAILLLGCGSIGTICCDDTCEATASCTTTTTTDESTGGPSCPADPTEGDVDATCGIWVSATLGDDAAEGTQAAPVRTLQRAVDLAAAGPGRVYACAQTYDLPVTVPAGVSLHGGWSCLGGTWTPTTERAAIVPDHDTIPLRLVAGSEGAESLITDLVARAADASGDGASSIAALADVGAVAELRRVELRAGDGADGADGAAGGPVPATGGTPGFAGDGACTATVGLGGEAPVTECDDGPSAGGEGGDGSDLFAQGGGEGAPDLGSGAGGVGEDVAPACSPGIDGSNGMTGQDGTGAAAGGALDASGYVVASGTGGTAGSRAQGGGGGGASRGTSGCGAAPHGGAGGGSGGAGGCGGKPGGGGQGGGASFALVSRSGDIRLSSARLLAGAGGRGGNGGAGQVGGLGGLPGLGGPYYPGQPQVHSGCSGGFGGKGGSGGNGGGGAGGPSAAIAHAFGSAPAQQQVELVPGAAGKGGVGGNPGEPALAGAVGKSGPILGL